MHTILIRSSSIALVLLARRVRQGLAAFGCRGRIGRGACNLRSVVLRAGVLCREELQGVQDEEIASGVVCDDGRFGGSVSACVVGGVCGCAFLRRLRNVAACLCELSWFVAVDADAMDARRSWSSGIPTRLRLPAERLVCAHKQLAASCSFPSSIANNSIKRASPKDEPLHITVYISLSIPQSRREIATVTPLEVLSNSLFWP